MHGPRQESWARPPRVRYLVCACLSCVCDVLMEPLGGFLLTAPTHNSHGQLVECCLQSLTLFYALRSLAFLRSIFALYSRRLLPLLSCLE